MEEKNKIGIKVHSLEKLSLKVSDNQNGIFMYLPIEPELKVETSGSHVDQLY